MKRAQCPRILLTMVLPCILVLYVEEVAAQQLRLCSDLHFLPVKKSRKPADTTCVMIENGFMYNKAEQIVKLSGLPMNFVVCRTNGTQNAFAALDKYGNRYIKYDDVFMKRLNSDSTALESMIILAHEIGHHIFFHTISTGAEGMASDYQQYGVPGTPYYDPQKYKKLEEQYQEVRRRQELEADRFVGFTMARKGIKFEQVASFYKKLNNYYHDKNESTHPPVDKRIEAIKEGFIQVDTLLSHQPINLTKLGKENLELVFNNTSKLERNKLLQKIQVDAVDTAGRSISNDQYRVYYGASGASLGQLDKQMLKPLNTYLGKEIDRNSSKIDDGQEYFELRFAMFHLYDFWTAQRIYIYGFHVRAGYFYLIMFDPVEGVKVVYKSRFSQDQISFEEIKLLFTRSFKIEVQKMIDFYLSQ